MLSLRFKRIALVMGVFVVLPIAAVIDPADAGARNLLATSPSLGTAASYSILAGSSVTNTGTTTMSGNVGISHGIGPIPHYVERAELTPAVELSRGGIQVCSDGRSCRRFGLV